MACPAVMIPYIHVSDFHIGPLPLHPFGILVATGVLIGSSVASRRARTLSYDLVKLNSFVTWMLVSGFILSHVLDQLFYHWDDVLSRPWSLAMPWEGLSSFGGFVGALVGIVLWKYFVIDNGRPRRRDRPHPILPFADLVLSAFPLGWMFGRAGCSTVHDHPGARAADSLLAVAYPCPAPFCRVPSDDSIVTHLGFIDIVHGHYPRFDLGLLELMFTVILVAFFALTWLRRVPVGTYVVASALAYAPVRFAMDFLRIGQNEGGDTRYASLTPAQWAAMALFGYGLYMILYIRRLRARGIDLESSVRAPQSATSPPPREAEATR